MLQRSDKHRHVLNRVTIFALGDFIRQHCHKNQDGKASYDLPWSDQLIFEQFPKLHPGHDEITFHHVKHIRRDLCGELTEHSGRGKGFAVFAGRFARLEARIAELEKWAAARPVVPFKIVEEIVDDETEPV